MVSMVRKMVLLLSSRGTSRGSSCSMDVPLGASLPRAVENDVLWRIQ